MSTFCDRWLMFHFCRRDIAKVWRDVARRQARQIQEAQNALIAAALERAGKEEA